MKNRIQEKSIDLQICLHRQKNLWLKLDWTLF